VSAAEHSQIAIVAGAQDCDALPKVAQAGKVLDGLTGRYQLMHNGVRVFEDCYYGPGMTERIRQLRGHHEPQEEFAFHNVLDHVDPRSAMLELGSYWGYYSLWFHHRIPSAQNLLIEPDPNNLEVGRQNFALNKMDARFFQYAIGRESRGLTSFSCNDSDAADQSVPQTSVDDFVESTGLQHVELLLADIQGAEVDMLEGAVRSIAEGKLRFVFISTHHHSISGDPLTHQKCLRFVADHGAYVLAEHSVSESFSGDGLIVASFRDSDRDIPAIAISHNRASNGFFRELEYELAESWQRAGEFSWRRLRKEYSRRLKALIHRVLRRGPNAR